MSELETANILERARLAAGAEYLNYLATRDAWQRNTLAAFDPVEYGFDMGAIEASRRAMDRVEALKETT